MNITIETILVYKLFFFYLCLFIRGSIDLHVCIWRKINGVKTNIYTTGPWRVIYNIHTHYKSFFSSSSKGALYLQSWVTQEDPRVTQEDPRMTQEDPRMTQDDPRVTQDDLGVTQDDPWVTKDDPRVTQDDPRVTQDHP